MVCKPKIHGGLGILNFTKFASAFCIRWLWNEWSIDPKPWVGLGSHCNKNDRALFVAATKVIIGGGKKLKPYFGRLLGLMA
jgi:hypothetical protein